MLQSEVARGDFGRSLSASRYRKPYTRTAEQMKFFWTPDVQRAVLGASFSELRLGTRADSRRTAGGFAPAHRTAARALWLLSLPRGTPDAEPNSPAEEKGPDRRSVGNQPNRSELLRARGNLTAQLFRSEALLALFLLRCRSFSSLRSNASSSS